jgi:hypothetical protein
MHNADNHEAIKRIAELEAENARLRQSLEIVKAERKALRDELYGPAVVERETTEADYIELVRNHKPGSTARIIAELGIAPRTPS